MPLSVQSLQPQGQISGVSTLPKPQSLVMQKLPTQPSLNVAPPAPQQPLQVKPLTPQPTLNSTVIDASGKKASPYLGTPKEKTTAELGWKWKQKYPVAYDDLSDEETGQKVKAKFTGAYDDFVDLPQINTEESKRGFFQNLIGPELTGLASASRAIQSTPDVFKAVGDYIKDPNAPGLLTKEFWQQGLSNDAIEGSNVAKALETQQKPVGNVKTAPGMTNKELLGTAAQAAGQGLMVGTGGTVAPFGLQQFGSSLQDDKSVLQSAGEGLLVGVGAKAINYAAPYAGKVLNAGYENLVPQAAKNFIEPVISKAGSFISQNLKKAGDTVNPVLDKVVPDFMSAKSLPQVAKERLSKPAISSLENTYNDLFGSTKSGTKVLNKSSQAGKDPAKFLAENGYVVDVSNGKVNSQAVIEKISQDVNPLETTLDDILKVKSSRMPDSELINLDDIAKASKSKINTSTARGGGTLQDQEKAVDNIISNLKQTYGEKVDLATLNEIKRGQWKESSAFNLNRPQFMGDVNYAIGSSAKNTIEQKVPEISIKNLNTHIGDHYDAIQNLRKVDGNAVKGGRLGRYFARQVGAIAGSMGGPAGTVAGALTGDYISELMQNNAIATPMKRAILSSIPKESPFYIEAQKALQQLKLGQPLLEGGFGKFKGNPRLPTINADVMEMPTKIRPLETGNPQYTQPNQLKLPPSSGIDKTAPRLPTKVRPLEINNSIRSLHFQPKYRKGGGKITQIFGE